MKLNSSYLFRRDYVYSKVKKFIIPAIATLVYIIGIACLAVPFIPLGWLFIALASLLLAPYLKFMRKFIGWLVKIDKTGFVEKAGEKAASLYEWAGDKNRGEQLKAIIQENTRDTKNPNGTND